MDVTLLTATLATVLLAAGWGPRLAAGLSLDEAGTWWVVRDGWREVIDRAVSVQGQSPLYYLIVWAVTSLAGTSETALRWPSIVSAAGCVWLVLRLGCRWFAPPVGALAVLVFLAFEPVIVAGATARPYAVALLCWLGATCALDTWLDDHRRTTMMAYLGCVVAMIYIHYVFAAALVLHGLLLGIRRTDIPPARRRELIAWALLGAAALLPALPQLGSLAQRREALTFVGPPPLGALLQAWAPPELTIAILLGGAVLALSRAWRRAGWRRPGGRLGFAVAWMLVPPALAFGASHATGTPLFFPRYYLAYAPALALVAALPIAGAGTTAWRRVYLTGFTLCVVIARTLAGTDADDGWRAAAVWLRGADPDRVCPLLAVTGFVESQRVEWLTDPVVGAFIRSPLEYYGFDGVTALPLGLDAPPRRAYAEDALARLSAAPCLWLAWRTDPVIHAGRWYPTAPTEVAVRLAQRGFARSDRGPFGRVMVARFDAPADPPAAPR